MPARNAAGAERFCSRNVLVFNCIGNTHSKKPRGT